MPRVARQPRRGPSSVSTPQTIHPLSRRQLHLRRPALLVLPEWSGEETYRARLAAYREVAAGTPPIRGLDRSDDAAFTALNRKEPVILADLADAAGGAAFDAFLREMATRRVSDTATCLAVLADTVSPAARDSLAAALAR